MSKYSNSLQDVFNVMATCPVPSYPQNFENKRDLNEFLRISLIPGNNGINLSSNSGLVIIDIFVPSNEGPKRLYEVADLLDSLFVGKMTGQTQFFHSTLNVIGIDENPSLFRGQYNLQYSHYEAM
jgi:hypothetical protein